MYTRITSQMMMTNYKNTLFKTMDNLSSSSQAVANERQYQNDSEEPVNASRAYQYRREINRNEQYISNTKNTSSLLKTRETVVMELSGMLRNSYSNMLGADSDTSSDESRGAYAMEMKQTQQAVIQSLNTSYGGAFIFGGTSSTTVPFTLEDDGTVTFRGIPVNGLSNSDLSAFKDDPSAVFGNAGLKEKYDDNMEKLRSYMNEKVFIDLGFGLQLDDKSDKSSMASSNSAYNMVNNAISFLGFGLDENGHSKNTIQLLGDISEAVDRGRSNYDHEEVMVLTQAYYSGMSDITIELTQMGADEKFMDNNLERLEDIQFNLAKKQNSVEFMDEAEAITHFEQTQYSYRAALQIGSQILSQSFLDYMR